MKLKITVGLFLATFLLSAQTARMNRDIEVAERILETLVEETKTIEGKTVQVLGQSNQVEGNYIDGFGVIFTISTRSLGSPLIWSKKNKNKNKIKWEGDVFVLGQGNKNIPEDTDKEKVIVQNNFKQVVETFICDYAYLMRQLKQTEKIMIRYGARSILDNNHFPVSILTHNNQHNYSASINKTAIDDYQKNDNKQQLIGRIDYVFIEAKDQKEKHKDLELLSNILKKLYKSKEEGTLHISGNPYYEKIPGLGVIYTIDIRSGGRFHYFGLAQNSRILWTEDRLILADPDKKEKEEKPTIDLDKNYATFLMDFKNTIMDYGSIVKNLEDGEALTFKLRFPKCDTCEKMPQQLEIIAKASTLAAYRKESISLEIAVNQLVIK